MNLYNTKYVVKFAEITCPKTIPEIPNGSVVQPRSHSIGDTTIYTCDANYDTTSGIIECLATGEWQTATCTGMY